MKQEKVKIYTKNLDSSTLEQFLNCTKETYVIDAALMPDAHFGYVAPIGSVIVTKKYIVPSWVGYDIGCGVSAIKLEGKNILKKIKEKRKEIYEIINKKVPMGLGKLNAEHNVSKESKEEFKKILKKLEETKIDPDLFDWIKRKALSNVGSLGHGNHFIEISEENEINPKFKKITKKTKQKTNKNVVWLIIHSGSRNVGHHVAGHYMKKAQELNEIDKTKLNESVEKTYPLDSTTKIGKEYLTTLNFCLELALLNRIEIGKKIISEVELILGEKIKNKLWANKNHNHAQKIGKSNKFIHRKGATPSKKGERGIIPGNMRDGSFLVLGKGNKKFLESSSHGAGRSMSKSQARKEITIDQFKETMKGITATIENGTIDESPFAYKNIYEVIEAQKESIKLYKYLKPIINLKGTEN
ncbi:MAG TPA: RtcB family protein [archaeon]|nr:RtcB family protein [archaeon]